MALTQVSTAGVKDDFITAAKIADDAVTSALIADDSISGALLTNNLDIPDNNKIRFGTGNDLEIYHSGSDSRIVDNGTGSLYIGGSQVELTNTAVNEVMLKAVPDGAVELYYDNSKKFETTSYGSASAGQLRVTSSNATTPAFSCGDAGTGFYNTGSNAIGYSANSTQKWNINSSGDLRLVDSVKATFGTGDDLQIYHDGTDNYIDSTIGNLYLRGPADASKWIILQAHSGENSVVAKPDGTVELYHDGNKKFETGSYGIGVTGYVQVGLGGSTWGMLANDNIKIGLGNGTDLQLYHDGASKIVSTSPATLYIASDQLQITNAGITEAQAKFFADGACELNYNNVKKLETWSGGLRITGAIKAVNSTADSHWGTDSSTWSQFQTLTANNIAIFENSHDSTPYGNYLYFSDAAPDNNVQYYIQCDDNSASRIKMYSDGDIWTSDAGTLTSDETLKENITDATSKLEDLKKLKVRNFYWKASFHPEKSKKKQLGFIAQEVETVFPNLIQEHDVAIGIPGDDHTPVMKKSIKQAWAPILVKALQEAIAKIETLETKVAALEAA